MANTWTLTSLAMLKVKIDVQHGDYLDYLLPFVLEVLRKDRPDIVQDAAVAQQLEDEFGLRIPHRGVHLVLGRLAKRGVIAKQDGVYRLVGEIKNTGISSRRQDAKHSIDTLVGHIAKFAKDEHEIEWTDDYAAEVLKNYLSEFGIDCLRTYIHRNALPSMPKKTPKELRVLNSFVRHVHQSSSEIFESFILVVKGNMLANALLCPDLQSLQKKFDSITFFLDTGFLLRVLGLQAKPQNDAAQDLVGLLSTLRGRLAVFDQTVNELTNILKLAEKHFNSVEKTLPLVAELREQGKTQSDVTLVRSQLSEILGRYNIHERQHPKHIEEHQIDEAKLDAQLQDAMQYRQDSARQHDVDCIRSVFTLRRGTRPVRLEDSLAVFVTTNRKVARVAFGFGKKFEHSREVSAAITDFSLANVAWLKAPLLAPNLPEHEVLAACYAALEPPPELWEKYLSEVDKLKDSSILSDSDHAFLRLDPIAKEELMDLTLGEVEELTPESVPRILARAKDEFLSEERKKHDQLSVENSSLREKQQAVMTKTYRFAEVVGNCTAWGVVMIFIISTALASGFLPKTWTESDGASFFWTASIGGLFIVGVSLGLIDLFFGHSVRDIFSFIRNRTSNFVFGHVVQLLGIREQKDTYEE